MRESGDAACPPISLGCFRDDALTRQEFLGMMA